MNFKDGKMILIIKEMFYSGNKYEINGIDLEKAVFFVRKSRELFKIVAPGDFTVKYEGSNVYLELNSAILTDIISIQVCYELVSDSRQYDTGSEPDINILVANYNKLVQDFKNLWGYIQKQTFVSDTLNMSLVFSLLGEGETWVYKDGEMRATPLIAAETELKNLLDELIKESQNILDDYVATLTVNSKTEISTLVGDSKNDIGTLATNSKAELTNLLNSSKTDINDYTEDKKAELTNFIDENMDDFTTYFEVRKEVNYLADTNYQETNIFGSGLKDIVAGEMYYYGNKPYMAIKTASNTTGFLAPDSKNFSDITNKNLNNLLKTNLLDYAEYIGVINADSTFKFFRFGKLAFFYINYYFSPAVLWPAKVTIAGYPSGFKPNTAFVKTLHSITNWNDGNKTDLLLEDKIYLTGHDPSIPIAALRGTIMYVTE